MRAVLPAVALAALALGCTDVDRYTTAPSESYCGSVTVSSTFRTGISPRMQMRLELNAGQLDGSLSPGVLWTDEKPDLDEGVPERRLLERAPLRRIPKMENDSLSLLEFGEGHEQNRIFAVTPAIETEDPLLAILSLRSDDGVEVRLLRPGLAGIGSRPPPAGRGPIFGQFTLYKLVGTCSF